ncbi:hypothetical protein Taro_056572, partial [Colocasia esculenta]|nr:hypothetical protein [Colocasia esculenta]
MRPYSHVVAPVFRELRCLSGCLPRVASACVDSAGFTGVVFGLTQVVVEVFLCFRYFVALCRRCFPLYYFVQQFCFRFVGVPAPLAGKELLFEFITYLTGLNSNPSGSSDPWVAAQPSGSLAGVREVGSLAGVREVGLREPTYGVAFTGAGLWSAELVEGVLALLAVPLLLGCVLVGCPLLVGVCPCWMSPCCWGVCCWLCVWPCVPVRRWVLCSTQLTSLLELSRCFVCHVARLVERCDTCLWLLSALCWLVANSGEVLPKFFSVGSGGGEVFSRTVLCLFLVVAALPSGLRCIAWLLCSGGASLGCPVFWCGFPELLVVVLVRFALRTVPGLFLPVV